MKVQMPLVMSLWRRQPKCVGEDSNKSNEENKKTQHKPRANGKRTASDMGEDQSVEVKSEGEAAFTPSPIKPRRRKKTSSTKKPRRLTIQDLTNDDDFNFLG